MILILILIQPVKIKIKIMIKIRSRRSTVRELGSGPDLEEFMLTKDRQTVHIPCSDGSAGLPEEAAASD